MFYFIFVLLFPFYAFAIRLDPIVVSSKTQAQSSAMTSSHQIITSKDLEEENLSNAMETLKNQPGIYINQTGGPGSQASIYIRGSEVRHILVLIDGVKVNDPSNPDKQFNAANLTSLDIERIEIIKGAQSVLYGSDAIGGVINIITKKGEPYQKVGVELGFQKQLTASVSHVAQRGVTYLNVYQAQSDGISAKSGGDEKDGYQKKGMTLNYSHAFDSFEAQWMVKMMQDYVENDGFNSSFQLVDDKNAYSKSLQQIYKQTLTKTTELGKFKYLLALNKNDRLVKYFNTNINNYTLSNYNGSNVMQDFNWLKKFSLGSAVFGLSHEYESFKQTGSDHRKINLYSAYTSINHRFGAYLMNLGLRSDTHEIFGQITTYNLGFEKRFSKRRFLKFNHATGFKAPTIYQLFVEYDGPYKVGNKNLHPERSKTFDLSYNKMGRNNYEITLFNNYIYDYFYYTTNGYINKGSFNSQGIEVSTSQKGKSFTFREGATLANFHLSDSSKVLRRPEQKIDLTCDYSFNDAIALSYNWKWVAARFDSNAGKTVVLNAYDLSNFSLNYKRKKNNYQVGVNNIFDRKYVDVYGYGTLGRTLFVKGNFTY